MPLVVPEELNSSVNDLLDSVEESSVERRAAKPEEEPIDHRRCDILQVYFR